MRISLFKTTFNIILVLLRGALLGHLKAFSGFLDILVPFMEHLDAHVHAHTRPLEPILGHLGASWGQLGAILGHLGVKMPPNSKNIDFPVGF